MADSPWLACAAIFVIGLAGGALPLWVKWSERQLHSVLALSTGVFLGAVFLHLLPALAELEVHKVEEAHAHEGHHHSQDLTLWFFVLIGVLAVYLIESLVFRSREHDHEELHRHRSVGYAALLGISIHAVSAGIGYSAAAHHQELLTPMLIAILGHKGMEAFSLTTVFQLAKLPQRQTIYLLVGFSALTPVAILAGSSLTSILSDEGLPILTALAAGTFLYVCLCELLPEVFHHLEDRLVKIPLLGLGIALMMILHEAGA